MKKLCMVFLLMLCVNANNHREISFTEDPFTENFIDEVWSTSSPEPWEWIERQKCIRSGHIPALQRSSCQLQFNSEEGVVAISFSTDLRGKEQSLRIFLDDALQGTYFYQGEKVLHIKVKRGTHVIKFVFRKVARAYGGGSCTINKISYPAQTKNLFQYKINHTDKKTNTSWGNNDEIAQSFEMLGVFANIKSAKDIPQLQYEVQVPQNIHLVPHTPVVFALPKNKEKQLHFSIISDGRFRENSIPLTIRLKSCDVQLQKLHYSIPFAYVDPARAFLEKETVITSKKFDFSSVEQLDQFLKDFPESELAPIIFALRLECCRKVRDAAIERNQNVKNRQQREQNIIKAINSYLVFIEKYPQRLLTKVAIHEVFQLYTKINRISFYHNFIERFPHSEHSLVANEHIKALMYELVCAKDSIEAYDTFAEMYPNMSFFTRQCCNLAQKKALQQEKDFIHNLVKKIDTKDKYIRQLALQSTRNKRANVLMNKWLLLTTALKDTKSSHQRFVTGVQIQRIKNTLHTYYNDTNVISTLLMMQKLDEIATISKEIKDLQQQLHKDTLQQMQNHFASLRKNIDDNFANTNKKIDTLHLSVAQLQKNLQLMHLDLNTKLSHIDTKISDGFMSLEQNLQRMEKSLLREMRSGTVAKYLTLLHYNLGNINDNILEANANIVQLSKGNDDFLRLNLSVLKAVQHNGEILDGWQQYQRGSSLRTAVSNTVVNIIEGSVGAIPVVGPITTRLAAPFIRWIGNKAGDRAVSLWSAIF
ncbi:hypothetical protein [Candidatus Uabimicrobium amorphum]|uniref:Uncharacterized protein n=1 Tax=Uabimicrobium amorphum TaxID=2596890 RepID=A0A5S9F5G3_UABAM|nr:hypothetical protein [Candidatus Uabimicrobium amorphum]BBM86825.1 hypothetical protein UABAM_05213 [Candidatus Uabimicrobium amorphum]